MKELRAVRKLGLVVVSSFAAFGILVTLLFSSAPSFAQGSSGRILGTITDQTGGSISGATVTVSDTQRGTSRVLTTDASGSYNAPDLQPGTYVVRAEAKGFKAL